jgi:hypothetical protein
MILDITTATNPFVELASQLSAQSSAVHQVLLKQIEVMVPTVPDDHPEFDALRGTFSENQVQIKSLLESQAMLLEDMIEVSEVKPEATQDAPPVA